MLFSMLHTSVQTLTALLQNCHLLTPSYVPVAVERNFDWIMAGLRDNRTGESGELHLRNYAHVR